MRSPGPAPPFAALQGKKVSQPKLTTLAGSGAAPGEAGGYTPPGSRTIRTKRKSSKGRRTSMSDERWDALSNGLADHLKSASTPRASVTTSDEEEGVIAPLS